ncbi:triacylglycerol lipase [Synechococcus sp. A15-60]|uniref:esterase/lipase family protein n=1 Tax=Synechococcus sp. A15-60 TaxID=1050655 RepID=UPI0016488695|nr:alpha/beta fold hydrolase [Synechococcus sp. A15-60]QNI47934.1 alpha/beta hydrolase fold family protein [Synechococcus sp. A15-60]
MTSSVPSATRRPLVLVHGLWDTPRLFRRLERQLEAHHIPLLVPHLPHRLGAVPLCNLAEQLDGHIRRQFGEEQTIDLLGFSMGGVISRIWLQQLGGAHRTHRFISVGSPQRGTVTAQWIPPWLFAGLADMKRGSPLLRRLNDDVASLRQVDCLSYFCRWDLMVVPGWQAHLPVGAVHSISVLTHQQLVSDSRALDRLEQALLRD